MNPTQRSKADRALRDVKNDRRVGPRVTVTLTRAGMQALRRVAAAQGLSQSKCAGRLIEWGIGAVDTAQREEAAKVARRR